MKKKFKLIIQGGLNPWIKKILMYMKLTCLVILLGVVHVFAVDGYAQIANISVSMKNASVESVLQSIEEQSDFYFLYSRSVVDVDRKVDLQVNKVKVADLLNTLFQGTGVIYKIDGRQIVLSGAEGNSSQQQKTIKGKVTDSSGEPVTGVTVVVKGTSNGIITDLDGNYSLGNVSDGATLVFSFVGMKTIEKQVAGVSVIDVQMKEDAIGIEEVVAVGYGTMKKSDLTGSVASVKSDEIIKVPVPRVDQALQGKIAGVSISNNKSQPGSKSTILIRGANSINGDNSPLVVVDGVLGVDMNMVNPNEIANVEVLKDASATAIYGSRGSNGVIIITTKSGSAGKTRFNFSSYCSVSHLDKKIDLLTADEWKEAVSIWNTDNDGGSAIDWSNEIIAKYGNEKGTDWQDEVFRSTAPIQSYFLSASGGVKNTTYSISGSVFTQDGIIKETGYNRQTLRIRLDQIVNDKIKFGTNLYFGRSVQDNTRIDTSGGSWGGSVTQTSLKFNPLIPVYDENGDYSTPYPASDAMNNPVATLYERTDQNNDLSIRANLYGDYEIIKGLAFHTSYTYSYNHLRKNFWAGGVLLESGGSGLGSVTNTDRSYWLSENTLTYDKLFGEHHLTAMGGFTASEEKYALALTQGSGFASEALKYNALQLAETYVVQTASESNSIASLLGRLSYSYKGRYLLTGSFRADGSSKFAINNKWGYFPSGSVGWRVSEEDFMDAVSQVSNLKLRVSYGSIGSQAIDPYQSLASYKITLNNLGSTLYPGIVSSSIANPNLKWETTTQFDLGVDFGLFNNRINVVADYYVKNTKDLLYQKEVPLYTGYTTQLQNIGEVQNKGFEFSINTINLNREFKWSSSFNISFNKNEVVNLGGDENSFYDASLGTQGDAYTSSVILQVGEALGSFYGYVFDGIYQNEAECTALPYPSVATCEPGMVKFKDIAGAEDGGPDGKITEKDREIIGCAQPDFVFGFGNDFSYKGFDLNILLQGSYGNDIMNINSATNSTISYRNAISDVLYKAWDGEGSTNSFQKIGKSGGTCSSRWIEDGSYVRFKNISLGYTLPNKSTSRWGIENLRFYVSGQNLFTITNYSWYDPEINSRSGEDNENIMLGVDWGGYPSVKTYTFGINLNF